MVSELTGPLGSATRGPWVWCPAQLTLHLVCAGPWSRGRTCGLGRGMGLVQGGLTEPPGPAAPFGLCHSTGHLSCHYCSLDQEGLKGTRRSIAPSAALHPSSNITFSVGAALTYLKLHSPFSALSSCVSPFSLPKIPYISLYVSSMMRGYFVSVALLHPQHLGQGWSQGR